MPKNRQKHTHQKSKIDNDNKKVSFNTSFTVLIKTMIKTYINRTHLKKASIFIVSFFVIGLITYYRDEMFKLFLGPKPRIIVNITKVEPLYINRIQRLDNFNLLFQTFSSKAVIAAVKVGEKSLNQLYGATYIPIPLINTNSSKNYSISFKNIGDEVAKNITIDLRSHKNIYILERDPRIKSINCGTTPNAKACHLEITSLSPNEEIFFSTINDEFEKEQFNFKVDGKSERVSLNFMTFSIIPYSPSLVMEMDGNKLKFPPINDTPTPRIYYYLKKDNSWKELLNSRKP